MEFHYLDYLFLDIFSTEDTVKPKSLYYILTGKRTVSVMLQAVRTERSRFFGLMPRLKWNVFIKKLQNLALAGLLSACEEEWRMTEKGKLMCEQYFKEHTRISNRDQLRYARVADEFRNRSLFLVQVLSQLAYQNKNYFPLSEGMEEQNWLKGFLKSINIDRKMLPENYGQEWLVLLEQAKIYEKELFLEQFDGFGYYQKTAQQAAEQTGKEEAEVRMVWHQNWLEILCLLEEKEDQFPVSARLFHELKENGGLCSGSVQETCRLWGKGVPWEKMAAYRKLKQSTINDHITELAILYPSFPFHQFLNSSQIEYIKSGTDTADYSEIKKVFPDISFFENRLMQVLSEVEKQNE